MMQSLLERISRWLMIGSVKVSEFSLKLAQRILIQLQRFWTWYNQIQFPRIPLSGIQWLLLFYVIFALAFLWATPIFEAADELAHFSVVETIRATGTLPVQDPEAPATTYREAGSQPPLYYGLAVLLISPFDLSDLDAYRLPNPHVITGTPNFSGNKNLVLHSLDGEPSQSPVQAVYVLRVLNLLFGAATIWVIFRCGALVAPQRPVAALIAASITAFNPMFLFLHTAANPFGLAILLNSLVIWLALLTLRNGFDTRRSFLLAVLLALAILTKISSLLLIPVLFIGTFWIARRDRSWRKWLMLVGAVIVVCLLIAGWWYWRNVTLYGELFGLHTMALIAGPRTEAMTLATFLQEFEWFRLTYWGIFGVSNIQTAFIVYVLADMLILIGLAGVVFLIAQLAAIRDFSFARHELLLLLFLAGIVLPAMIAHVIWNTQTYAAEGYLLFPFLAAISPLLAAGLAEIAWWILFLLTPPERSYMRAGEVVSEPLLQTFVRWGIRSGAFIVIFIPFVSITPQYAAPAPQPESAIASTATRIFARYEQVELIAYEAFDRRYAPGEPVRVTLYWRVLAPTDQDLSLTLNLTDPYGNVLSGLDTYPGAGTLRTSKWQPGAIYADTYVLTLPRLLTSRAPFYLTVNWFDQVPQQQIQIAGSDGYSLSSVHLNIGALVSPGYLLNTENIISLDDIDPLTRDFQNEIRLRGFSFDPMLGFVQVHWQALEQMNTNYKSFVHIYNEDGELVTQDDIYPELPTRYWYFGEEFILSYLPDEPAGGWQPGTYSLQVGWYDEADPLARLLIGLEEDQVSTYQLFEFSVGEEGQLLLPVFDESGEQTETAPQAVPMPEQTPTGAVPESTESDE